MSGGVVRDVLHGLEPVVGVTELGNDQSVVRVAIKARELEPMLVASEFGFDRYRMVETRAQVAPRPPRPRISFSQDGNLFDRHGRRLVRAKVKARTQGRARLVHLTKGIDGQRTKTKRHALCVGTRLGAVAVWFGSIFFVQSRSFVVVGRRGFEIGVAHGVIDVDVDGFEIEEDNYYESVDEN